MAPTIFQQVINTIISSLDYAVAYLDDVLIKSETRLQHADHIHQEFQRIED